jgi:hypothetical protein
MESEFFEKMHHEAKQVESARQGGNVYINNNINLYISKNVEMGSFGQTFVRGQLAHEKEQERAEEKEVSRRQIFLNKRRGNNFMAPVDM